MDEFKTKPAVLDGSVFTTIEHLNQFCQRKSSYGSIKTATHQQEVDHCVYDDIHQTSRAEGDNGDSDDDDGLLMVCETDTLKSLRSKMKKNNVPFPGTIGEESLASTTPISISNETSPNSSIHTTTAKSYITAPLHTSLPPFQLSTPLWGQPIKHACNIPSPLSRASGITYKSQCRLRSTAALGNAKVSKTRALRRKLRQSYAHMNNVGAIDSSQCLGFANILREKKLETINLAKLYECSSASAPAPTPPILSSDISALIPLSKLPRAFEQSQLHTFVPHKEPMVYPHTGSMNASSPVFVPSFITSPSQSTTYAYDPSITTLALNVEDASLNYADESFAPKVGKPLLERLASCVCQGDNSCEANECNTHADTTNSHRSLSDCSCDDWDKHGREGCCRARSAAKILLSMQVVSSNGLNGFPNE